MGLKSIIKNNRFLHRVVYSMIFDIPGRMFGEKWCVFLIKVKYRWIFGKKINLKDPQTLNEKLQWLKLHDHKDFYTTCADKLAVREYWKQFGEDALIPLLFQTKDWRQITYQNLPAEPCIVKCNTGSGMFQIVRDKREIDIKKLRAQCRQWLRGNYYFQSQELQYKDITPCIIIEKLLLDRNGHIPNDYKLHYFNGKLQFVYCSVDREGENYRAIYTPDWERINMEWVGKKDHKGGLIGNGITAPSTFSRMREIADEVAKNFKYVRVDFYDVDGKLYYGEITLHHGSGFDTFVPEEYDLYYGKKLQLQ